MQTLVLRRAAARAATEDEVLAAAIALGYGLWVWSSKVEDWIGIPELLPIIRLVVIIAGLTVAEMAYQRAAQFIAQKN